MIELHIEAAFYGTAPPVIKNFSMTVDPGEVVAVTGASGQGKSTLLKILAGLHKGMTGTLQIAQPQSIVLIPQKCSLLPWKTVYGNMVALAKARKQDIQPEKAAALLGELGLAGYEKRYPNSLSGGQYQRVALGQAFYTEPALLLMDEPFTGLDSQTRREVQGVFSALQQRMGMTTVFVTHNLEEAYDLNSRIISLDAL